MKKSDMESFASEYCMSAGDNALRRDQIDASIVSEATTNEHSFRKACMAGLNAVAGDAAPSPPPPPEDSDIAMAADLPDHGIRSAKPRAVADGRTDTAP